MTSAPDLRHWHDEPWRWWPDGDDAVCTHCGERAEGAGVWARAHLQWTQEPARQIAPVRGDISWVLFALLAVWILLLAMLVTLVLLELTAEYGRGGGWR